jgi:hypothetical protein
MAKIYTYVVIALTLQVVLHVLGINGGIGTLISVFASGGTLTPATITTGLFASTFWNTIVNKIGVLAAVAAVTIGFFGAQRFTVPVTATIASLLLLAFVGDWLALVNTIGTGGVDDPVAWFLMILVIPFVGGYVLAVWDWVRSPGDT